MQQQQPGQRQQSVRNSRSSAPYIPTDRQFQGFIQGLRSCSVSPDRVSVHPPACSFSSTSSCPCVRIWEGQTDHFLFSGPGNFIQFPLFLISADSLGDYHHIQRLLKLLLSA
ncbi:Hypothetical predicted protein [Xyrichtys novacula]|uniref:VQ domain-containing protein n=1 Tax=Xyrichtys novacula TaxID=13765 RepID=A0AAV1F0U5_XYRNO|nr:Hypothetical predicted protein [Xyrichtys novacula]